MKSSHIHPSFKLNGLFFDNPGDLLEFATQLKRDGSPHEVSMGKFIYKWLDDDEYVKVKTSGSTGKPKKIKLAKQSMINSATATGTYFKTGPGTTALLCLHPKFIAGKMMLVRAMTLGWDLHVVAPEKDALTQYDNKYDFAAMVPYQVHHSIKSLNKLKKLIIGGGPVSLELEQLLDEVETECFATYGMTETITHIAVRRINGLAKSEAYAALPNVKFSSDSRGCLVIDAPQITPDTLVTNDLVTLETPTRFKWLGRFDNVINSGGIKIYPETIEKKLSPFIDTSFIITSEQDKELGERLILVIEHDDDDNIPNYKEAFEILEPFEKPKRIYALSQFPYTDNGKIKRGVVKKVLEKK